MNYCVEKQSLACMAWVTYCYGQLEESLDKCNPDSQLILKDRIFDMLDRVKFLLDKKYEPNPKGNTNNPKFVKGASIMKHELDNSNRHAHNTLAEANARLDSGKVSDPREHAMLISMIKDAREIIKTHDETSDRRPYSDTNIGYRSGAKGHTKTSDDVNDLVDAFMDLADRIIPHLDRYDDDMDEVDDRRGRPRRTRRGVGRWTQVRRHVRRMPRGEMDDMRYDDDRYADDRYDDDMRYESDDRRSIPRGARNDRVDDDRHMRNDRTTDDRRMDRTDDGRTDEHRAIGPRG